MHDQEPQKMDWLFAEHAAKNISVLQPPQLSMPLEPGSQTLLLEAHKLRGSVGDLTLPKGAIKQLTPSYARWAYALCRTVAQMGLLGVYCSDEHLVWLRNRHSAGAKVDPKNQMAPAAQNVLELNPTGLMWLGHFGAKEARVATDLVKCDVLEEIARAGTQSWPPEIGTAHIRAMVTLSIETLLRAVEEPSRAS